MSGNVIRGVHVFWSVAAFFTAVIAVDVYFVTSAVRTFPGEEVKNSYVLGLDYNREVARREKQEALGWVAEAGLSNETGPVLLVRLHTASGAPVTGLSITANVRAAGRGGDGQMVTLSERRPGEYAAAMPTPGRGKLDLEIAAQRLGESDVVFEATKTLVIA